MQDGRKARIKRVAQGDAVRTHPARALHAGPHLPVGPHRRHAVGRCAARPRGFERRRVVMHKRQPERLHLGRKHGQMPRIDLHRVLARGISRQYIQHALQVFGPIHALAARIHLPARRGCGADEARDVNAHAVEQIEGLGYTRTVLTVDVCLHAHVKSRLDACANGPQGILLGAWARTHPIVVAHTVKRDFDLRPKRKRRQTLQHGLREEAPVGVELVDKHVPRIHRLHDVKEAWVHERLAARDEHGLDTGLGRLIKQAFYLRKRELIMQAGIVGGVEAVDAVVVAARRDFKPDPRHDAVGAGAMTLPGGQGACARLAGAGDTVTYELFQLRRFFERRGCVAELGHVELGPGQTVRPGFKAAHVGIRHALPRPERHVWMKDVCLRHFGYVPHRYSSCRRTSS